MTKYTTRRKKINIVLFSISVIYIFALGLMDDFVDMHFAYYTLISSIYIVSIFTVGNSGHKYFYVPAVLVVLTWITEFIDLPFLSTVSGLLSTFFFLLVIVLLIIRVANSKTVGPLEFLESINVYLLLGIAGSVLFSAIYTYNPEAFRHPGEPLGSHSDFIYFSFVTMTTLGYGDITPVDSLARSLTIFFSVAGQLYLTMIIAMLVGKFLGQKTEQELKK